MNRSSLHIGLVLVVLPSMYGTAAAVEPVTPPRASFQKVVPKVDATFEPATARRGQTITWRFTADLDPDWYTYTAEQVEDGARAQRTRFTFPDSGPVVFVGSLSEPKHKAKAIPELKLNEVRVLEDPKLVWERTAVVSPEATPGPTKVQTEVKMVVCSKSTGSCLPLQTLTFEVPLTVTDEPAVPVEDKYKDALTSVANGARTPDPPSTSPPGQATKPDDGLLAFMLAGVIWGAISLLTPCVFPMIPITVSFFLKQSEKTHHRPLGMAVVYSATIVVVLTIGAVLLLGVFQAAIQYWVTNVILGALFVFFALSLLGMYDITLPSGLANFTSSRQGQGGVAGTVFMALTFSIISFSCVAPFLGGFAALVPSFGNVMEMIEAGHVGQLLALFLKLLLGALAFSVTFASPFFFLALFPSLLRAMPKSGSWMNTVKVVMGFLEVAAAIKFLRAAELLAFGEANLLTFDLSLGLYVALSLLCGLYLLGLYRLPHDDPSEHLGVPRLLVSALFLGLALYLIPGLFKLDAEKRQRPVGAVFAWLESFLLPEVSEHIGSLAEGLKEAEKQGKLVFVDFTGIS